jgi:GH24 family phage-related lysozyme (muramidase)
MSITAAGTAWLAEVERRIAINDGKRLTRYRDSNDIWTLGIGCNLERGDAPVMLRACGIDYAAVMADEAITEVQATKLFTACFAPIVASARASLEPGIYDALTDARRFVLCDLNYNLGAAGWLDFTTSRNLLNLAQTAKMRGQEPTAHVLFGRCADDLAADAWAAQTGDRAKRDIAMIRSGEWVDAAGDGS